jgi:predicted PurR-regulated permease PerM
VILASFLATASAESIVLIVEVGLVLIALAGIIWKGGNLVGELRTGQRNVVGDIAAINARIDTLQSTELSKMRDDLTRTTTATAELRGMIMSISAQSGWVARTQSE